MRRLLWPLLVFALCLPVALLAYGFKLPGLGPTQYAALRDVPDGDQEVAWFHTTTSGSTWERFVSGAQRAQLLLPGLTVDASNAFLDQTTDVPEVVFGMRGQPGKLHVRWYKLNNDHPPAFWVNALADRKPAPLAVIGGGSSDRARDMAWALAQQTRWHGDRPLFLITTATAEAVYAETEDATCLDQVGQMTPLLRIYDGRSFRFCFSNKQMAEALLDFVWRSPELRPQAFADTAAQAVGSGLLAYHSLEHRPAVFKIEWCDDPYSSDLLEQFQDAIPEVLSGYHPRGGPVPLPRPFRWRVPFSVGGYYRPNVEEERKANDLLQVIAEQPPQRSLLVIPTVAALARRLLRTLAEAAPDIGRQLVAINGDGMGVNTVLRDGAFAWPVRALPVPLLLFTHNNPVGWDDPDPAGPAPPPGSELLPPNSTEDVLHFADLVRTLAAAAFGVSAEPGDEPTRGGLVTRADELSARLHGRRIPFFDEAGNRLGGTGEYVLLVNPEGETAGARGGQPDATVEVWRRAADRSWRPVRVLPLHQSRMRTGLGATPPGRSRG